MAGLLCILFAWIQTPLSTRRHVRSCKMPGTRTHSAPLKVIKIGGWGVTAQWSAVITATDVPAPPQLIEGKSQSVTKNLNHTSLCTQMSAWCVITEPLTHSHKHRDTTMYMFTASSDFFSPLFSSVFLQTPWKERWKLESTSSNAWSWHVANWMKPRQNCLLRSYRNYYATNTRTTGTLTAPARARRTGNY